MTAAPLPQRVKSTSACVSGHSSSHGPESELSGLMKSTRVVDCSTHLASEGPLAQRSELLLALLPAEWRETLDRARVEPILEAGWRAFAAEFPGVEEPIERALSHLAARMATASADALASLTLPHLWLACACVHGSATAIRSFDQRFMPVVRRALTGLRLTPALVEEVEQIARVALLVPKDGSPAKLAEYHGRSPLGPWLKVTAIRLAHSHLRRHAREVPAENDWLIAIALDADSPEQRAVRANARGLLQEALSRALARLQARQQNLLRQHHIDALSLEELARLYRVHRATAARWLAEARAELLDRLRRVLQSELHVSASDCESLINLSLPGLELSLRFSVT
jgi:RNA polymerase sigma-70 factor (ECF subfamily)